MQPAKIKILNQEIDPDGRTPSYYRMLVNEKHFKYITIDPGIYEVDDLCFPPILLEKLPHFPPGDWNCGRIAKRDEGGSTSAAYFAETSSRTLPGIRPLWHPKSFDYLSLKNQERLKSNVYLASSAQHPGGPVIAKFARFDWEVGYYVAETQAYAWIAGHSIGPMFLGHLLENGRAIGFVLERVQGRHASISDLAQCEAAVRRLHRIGILHGDLNRHNFLVSEKGATLIDFESARQSRDKEAMQREMEGLKEHLLDESGNGGVTRMEDDH